MNRRSRRQMNMSRRVLNTASRHTGLNQFALREKHLQEVKEYLVTKEQALAKNKEQANVVLQYDAVTAALDDLKFERFNAVLAYLHTQMVLCDQAIDELVEQFQTQPDRQVELSNQIKVWRNEVTQIQLWTSTLQP